MNEFLWILMVGVAGGWLTGKIIGEKGYGKASDGYGTDWMDMILGAAGASIGGYLFFWAVIGEESSFSRYATAILGSIASVGVVRLISAKYLLSDMR